MLLEARELDVRYGSVRAVRAVSLQLRQGEIVEPEFLEAAMKPRPVFQLARNEKAFVVVQQADLGWRDAARTAVKQPHAQALFQCRHVLGCRRLRDAQVGRCLAERAGLDHADEKLHALQ